MPRGLRGESFFIFPELNCVTVPWLLTYTNVDFKIVAKQVGQIEADLKVKSQAYNALKTSLQNMEKKQTGSLMTRNLGRVIFHLKNNVSSAY